MSVTEKDTTARLRDIEKELDGLSEIALSALNAGLIQTVDGDRGKNKHQREKAEVEIYFKATRLRLQAIQARHNVEKNTQLELEL